MERVSTSITSPSIPRFSIATRSPYLNCDIRFSSPGFEYHAEPRLAAHHAFEAFRRPLEWQRLDHRAHAGLHREAQRVLGIGARTRRPRLDGAARADHRAGVDRKRLGSGPDDEQLSID